MGSVPWLLVIPSPYWLLVTCPFACVCHVIPRVNWKTKSCLGTTALTSRATTKGWKSTHSWPVGEALAILAEQTGSVGSGLELWWIMVVVCCCDMWCIRTPVKSIQPYQAMFQTCCHTIQSIRFLFFFVCVFLCWVFDDQHPRMKQRSDAPDTALTCPPGTARSKPLIQAVGMGQRWMLAPKVSQHGYTMITQNGISTSLMTVQASPSRACCLEQISSIFSDMHGLEFKNDKKGGPRQTLTCIFANLNWFFFF